MRKSDKFDVVVIGAGMGGICTAARLAHKGYKTLLTERLAFLGGRCSTLETEGFLKTTGAIIIPAGSVIEDTFREVGAEYNVQRLESCWRVEGEDHAWPVNEGLARAMLAISKDKDGANRVLEALMRGVTWQPPIGNISLREWGLQYTDDERIFHAFHPLVTALLCTNIDELPAADLFKFLQGQSVRPWEIAIAPKGNLELLRPLLQVIEQNGGEIRRNTEVQRILVEGHKATGLVIKTLKGVEQVVSARAIVSNTGPRATVALAGREYFEKSYLKELELVQPVPLYITVNISSDEPLIDHPGLVWPVGARKISALMVPTASCPELAPGGKHLLHAWGAMTKPVRSAINVQNEIKATLDELKSLVPAMAEKGTVLSIECFDREWPCFRCLTSELPHRTSVVDLYNVGDGIRTGGNVGVTLAAETARIVAQDIMSRMQPAC